MKPIICALLLLVSTVILSRLSLQLEVVALRHQLTVYQRTTKHPQISSGDRILWSWLSRRWSGWRDALVFVWTGTVIAWQRKRFRDHWAKLSKHGRPGRPTVSEEMGLSGSRKGYKQLNGHRFICTFDGANLIKRQRKQNLWPQARLSENY